MTDTDVRAPLSATAATMMGGAAPPRKQAPRPLSPQALEAASEWVRIPMSAGVDSLNVAAAAAVAAYALRR